MRASMRPISQSPRGELPPTAGLPARLRDFLPPWLADFAARAAAWLDTDWALLTCSGTAALWIALEALKTLAPERHSVVIPAYTCPLVAEAVLRAGLRPRLCDIAAAHFDLDTQALAGLCDTDTLAVLPTHLGGRVVDVGAAQAIAARVGAFVIEDAAQAFGARANANRRTRKRGAARRCRLLQLLGWQGVDAVRRWLADRARHWRSASAAWCMAARAGICAARSSCWATPRCTGHARWGWSMEHRCVARWIATM